MTDGLDDVAGELAARATQVEAAGDQLIRAAAAAIWTSEAADAFRAEVAHRNGRCADVAAALRAAASGVRAYADAVAAEKALLAHLAQLATQAPAQVAAAAEAVAGAGASVARSVGRVASW